MQMLECHQPEIHRAMTSMSGMADVEASYDKLPNLSIDYGLAEKADKVAVVPVSMDWSDLGSWESIYQHRDKDEAGNITQGDILIAGYARQPAMELEWPAGYFGRTKYCRDSDR